MARIPATWKAGARTETYLEVLFRSLANDKALPKFQFERRIDAILRVFLPELLSKRFGGEVVVVVPEFPLKKADSNQSTNVDYLMFRKAPVPSEERWLFLELKTDSGSIRPEQLATYRAAMAKGMRRLVAEIQPIADASVARRKYAVLQSRLDGYPLDRPLELIVLAPRREDVVDTDARTHFLTFQDLADLHVEHFQEEWASLCRLVFAPAFGVRVKAT